MARKKVREVTAAEARQALREAGVEVGARGRFSAAHVEALAKLGLTVKPAA